MSDGSIQFAFHEITLDDLRLANAGKTPIPWSNGAMPRTRSRPSPRRTPAPK